VTAHIVAGKLKNLFEPMSYQGVSRALIDASLPRSIKARAEEIDANDRRRWLSLECLAV
jgi:hypothetical protein